MKYNPDIHLRRSIRLKGYDYAQAGAYFVSICTQNRECMFGEIVDSRMVLNDAGRMIHIVWDEIPSHYPGIEIDAFVIMPNHIHGIVVIVGAAPRGRPDDGRGRPVSGQARGPAPTGMDIGQPRGVAPTLSLPDVVHRFKTMTTKRYTDGVKQYGWPPFPGKLWQRNYYEHIIRLSACGHAQAGNENELNHIRQYIIHNPMKWEFDRENPNVGHQIGQPRGVAPTGTDEPWRI